MADNITFDKNKAEQELQDVLNTDLNVQKNRNKLYYLVDNYCHNQCKALLRGLNMNEEIMELRIGEATLEIFEKIIKGARPQSLSAFGYWPCKRALQSKQAIQQDRETFSYEEYTKGIEVKEHEFEDKKDE